MARLTRLMLARPLRAPKVIPVKVRLAKPELVAVERLERFIRERRRVAPPIPAEKRRIARIRRRISKEEEEALRRLERFITKRRKVAPPAKVVKKPKPKTVKKPAPKAVRKPRKPVKK
jgi:hypothetical protein